MAEAYVFESREDFEDEVKRIIKDNLTISVDNKYGDGYTVSLKIDNSWSGEEFSSDSLPTPRVSF